MYEQSTEGFIQYLSDLLDHQEDVSEACLKRLEELGEVAKDDVPGCRCTWFWTATGEVVGG